MAAEEKKRVMVSLIVEQVEKLEAVCKETGLSKSVVVALALGDWIARRER